jgi:diadenosine tetraphosphate (Ap4A) HIT family hydrolase
VSCVFCTDPARSGEIVFEDDRTLVILHEDWSPRGHAMVVAKRHVENASDLDADDWTHMTAVWHCAERVLLEATGADRAVILKLGIMTPHLHVHIYPVSAGADRAEVFAMFDGQRGTARDGGFVDEVRALLMPRQTPT